MSHNWSTEAEIKRGNEIHAGFKRDSLVREAMQTMDATVWAKAFVAHTKNNPAIATDEETMVGWFANAIMCGFDRKRPPVAA